MNNTDRAAAVRSILSADLTNFETEFINDRIDAASNEIMRRVDIITANDSNDKTKVLQMLKAAAYLLQTFNY